MSETTPHHTDLDARIALRTRAFLAAALGLVGSLGGSLASAIGWFFLHDSSTSLWVQLLPQVAVAGGLGAAALVLAQPATAVRDELATPLSRVAQVLGLLALVSAALLLLGGFTH